MYALIEFKGKQFKAEKGKTLKVDLLKEEAGEKIEINSVLLLSDEGKLSVGTPYLNGVKVLAVVKEHKKDKKIIVFKYKPKKDYRRKRGHRQEYSYIQIEDISR